MYSPIKLIYKYFRFKAVASNAKGHGVHSPFVYNLIRNVLLDKREFYAYEAIEDCRKDLLKDKRVLNIEDFGAGSRSQKSNQRTVSAIAHSSLKPKKFSQLLFRIVNYYQPGNILELGTSLGITSAYLASANDNAKVVTMEGSEEIAAIAQSNFQKLHLKNISLLVGNFDQQLPVFLTNVEKLDIVFIDGNHRLEPTLRYFEMLLSKIHEGSILIFDDIHWSKEMEMSWKQIQEHPLVTVTVDLFFIGLVFFRKENKVKQHFQINF